MNCIGCGGPNATTYLVMESGKIFSLDSPYLPRHGEGNMLTLCPTCVRGRRTGIYNNVSILIVDSNEDVQKDQASE